MGLIINKFKKKLLNDSHLTELLKGTSVSFLFRIIGLFLGYIFTLIITRAYGAEAMGIYALSLVVLGVATLIGKLGLDTALLKLIAELASQNRRNEIHTLYVEVMKLAFLFSIIIAVSTYYLSPFIAHFVFQKTYLTEYFQIISLAIVPLVLLSMNREAIRGLKKIKLYSLLSNVIVSLIATVLLVLLYFYKIENQIPLIAQVVAIFFASALSFVLWLKQKSSLIHKNVTKEHFKYREVLSISLPMLLTSSMTLIMGWTDITMLGIYATEADIGIYTVALKISMITSIALVAINTIAAPKFAEFWGLKDLEGLSKTVQQSTKLIFWASFPILILILIFPTKVLGIFGTEFTAGSYALIALTIAQFVNSISGSVGFILNMTNLQIALRNIALFSAIINVILNIILIPKFGITGAAIATGFSVILRNLVSVIYIKKRLNISTWYLPLVKC